MVTAVATDNTGATSRSSSSTVTVTAPGPDLPAPWQSSDIGQVGLPGSATGIDGSFSISASGVDIWNQADSFHFLHQPLTGDGQITARVVSQGGTDEWALAGAMIRETLQDDARHAFFGVTPDHGLSFTRRTVTGELSEYSDGGDGSAPIWVRLSRTGDVFTAYRSADGSTWTPSGTSRISMSNTVYVGLASTSHNNDVLTTDTFDNVSIDGPTDRTAPMISAVGASDINQNGGSITWTTDEPADSQIEYGTTASYGQSTAVNTSLVTAHSSVVSGLDAATTYHYRVKSRDAAGNLAVSGDAVFRTPDDGGSPPPLGLPGSIIAVPATRILDSRISQGAAGPVNAMSSITIPITGNGGIPTTGVGAVVLNLTVTQPSTGGYIAAVPSGTTPTTSSLNFTTQSTVANLVIVPVGPDGQITLHNRSAGTVQLIADVSGYIRSGTPTTPGALAPVNPARILDSRISQGAAGPVNAMSSITIPITGNGGIPTTGVGAVVLNLTVTQPSTGGYIAAVPSGTTPTTSSLNFTTQSTVANLVIVPVGPDGQITLHNRSAGTVQLIADVSGYIRSGTPTTPGALAPVNPARILDSRISQGAAGPVNAMSSITIPITGNGGIPTTGVGAVVLNLTVTQPSTGGYIAAVPSGTTPTTSSLNFTTQSTVANLVIVPVGPDGQITLHNSSAGTVQLIADVSGYLIS